jgi:hypothetical protein
MEEDRQRGRGTQATRFFELLKALAEAGKVHKSAVDGKWEQIFRNSGNPGVYKDQ